MLDTHLPASQLLDHVGDRDLLEQLVAGVRQGQSRTLVLRGEAGVGKTALLGHVDSAEGCRIARAAAFESEMEPAFAGLHALYAHMLGHLGHPASPQGDALSTAFSPSAGPPPDRVLVALAAVLGLLPDAGGEESPLIVSSRRDRREALSDRAVSRGEAGIGKTALLDFVAAQASGCRVARAVGV